MTRSLLFQMDLNKAGQDAAAVAAVLDAGRYISAAGTWALDQNTEARKWMPDESKADHDKHLPVRHPGCFHDVLGREVDWQCDSKPPSSPASTGAVCPEQASGRLQAAKDQGGQGERGHGDQAARSGEQGPPAAFPPGRFGTSPTGK